MSLETLEQLKRLDAKLRHELGPVIVAALEDTDITEICVNADGRIWLESHRERIYDTGERIEPENLKAALGTIASISGKELNEAKPILESRLPLDGSRVVGTIPPMTPEGPSMNIRKHASAVFPLARYAEEGRISESAAGYIREAIRGAKNIMVAGGTKSGKTTFVNALIREITETAPHERLLIIEDALELKCESANRLRFVATEEVSMRTLVQTSMRERPDRIIIGEVRKGDATLELLKAWNTGHPGGLTTIHANDAISVFSRLELLILEVSENPLSSLIAEAVNVVVYMAGRQVTEIIEVTGFSEGEGGYRYEPVYRISGGRKNG